MNVAVFSGSFNPIHVGHLILGSYVTEFTDIDEVWFLVTPQSPFKAGLDSLDEKERLKMVGLALKDYPNLKASDFEFTLTKPSYTVNTLTLLKEKYPEHNFSLLIGADNWTVFDKWKDNQIILDNFKIYVYPRLDFNISIPSKFRSCVEALDTPIIEISSTFIRESLQKGKNIKAFLPETVYAYIIENGLYK